MHNPEPIRPGLRRSRTAIVLVGLSSTIGFLQGLYGIVIRTLEDHAIHGRRYWHQPLGVLLLLAVGWLFSVAVLVPAAAIGAAELSTHSRSGRTRAAAFVALLSLGVVGQYWATWRASHSPPLALIREEWLHDGRPWFALSSLIALAVFAGAGTLLNFVTAGARTRSAFDAGSRA